MTEKQYTSLQRLVQASLATVVTGLTFLFLVGVYAISDWLLS